MPRSERGATIQAIGPQNIAQATLGLKGGDVPQNILVPDLLGTIELGRRTEPELLFEQGIVPWRAWVNAAAGGAGQFTQIELLNPADLITVFWFQFTEIVASEIHLVMGIPAVPALANGTPLIPVDTRVSRILVETPAAPLLRSGTRAAVIGANFLWVTSNTTSLLSALIGPFVAGLPDNQATDNHYVLENATANQRLQVNFVGYSLPARAR